MSISFVVRHAVREGRASWKRLALYMSSITLGVAALVAINSFRTNAVNSVAAEARALLGADLRLTSNREFPQPVELLLDSAARSHDVVRVTTLVSMGVAAHSGDTRLVQLRAVQPGYPFYGAVTTAPREAWRDLHARPSAVVDEALLSQLGLQQGDTLLLGESAFVVSGVFTKAPADLSFRTIIGPRVYISDRYLAGTGLLSFGSLAQYQAFVRMPDAKQLERYVDRRHDLLRRNLIDFDTADEQGDNLTQALDSISRFLGLVGLAALLLGGIGVASAVHVFVKDKRKVIAVLRCLGAKQRTVFAAYLVQAAALAFAGAALGVVLGFVVQAFLPRVLEAVVPFDVAFVIDWRAVAAGLGIGVLVAVLFAIVPLLGVRGISPLQALRVDYEPPRRRFDPYRVMALVALILGITGLSLWQANDYRPGLAFSAALAFTLGVLWLTAWLLIRVTRRFFPRRAPFPIRQGVANLFRPHNQTVSVTLALGFGVFVIATMLSVQSNILGWLSIEGSETAPNLLAFDIQSDQREDVESVFRAHGVSAVSFTPIVPARISRINGVPIDTILSGANARKVEPWAVRREYRHTYRDTLVGSEKVVAGKWLSREGVADGVAPISMEADLAGSLNVKLNDQITWDFQGIPIETRITSLRKVDWARFDTNFFVIFPSGVLEKAPQTAVALARVPEVATRTQLQRDLVATHSNVSVVDLATVRAAFEDMIGKMTMAVRFMALFSIIAGVIVLIGAVATSRFQRLRESALLKTLGATRKQVMQVLVTEYAALGMLAAMTGVVLGGTAGWALMRFFFKLEYQPPLLALSVLTAGVALLAVTVGLVNSRDVFRREPLAVLREISE
ncbi:MAG TPA: FtsX-like permease family protein [Longimicrobiales bacterium]